MIELKLIDRETLESLKPNGLKPGMCWYCPWLYDPNNPEEGLRDGQYLSPYYFRDWAKVRPPICVVTPSGDHWLIDSRSSNGDGWQITGELPKLSASPSILVPGYHGFLQNGVFTADLDGRRYE